MGKGPETICWLSLRLAHRSRRQEIFHNGAGGTYDCIALMAYYTVCRSVTDLNEIEEMESELFLPAFRLLSKFVDCNRPFFKKQMYKSFANAKRQCDSWHDYEMYVVAPFDEDKPIYYEFTACPAAEFAKGTSFWR